MLEKHLLFVTYNHAFLTEIGGTRYPPRQELLELYQTSRSVWNVEFYPIEVLQISLNKRALSVPHHGVQVHHQLEALLIQDVERRFSKSTLQRSW